MKNTTRASTLEPAIPARLTLAERRPSVAPRGFVPATPSYSARLSESVTVTPMMFVGIQCTGYGADVSEAEARLAASIGRERGPRFHDRAEFVDPAGALNVLYACYWSSRTEFALWQAAMQPGWWIGDTSTGLGYFCETFTPGIEDVETTFSHPVAEGYARLSDEFSGETDTHGYWGSARERIPRSQADALEPSGRVGIHSSRTTASGAAHIAVEPSDNIFLLRSGQDWSDASGEERDFYLTRVKPTLEIGMREITERGLSIGCIFNRYVDVMDAHGVATDRTYSLSAWRSLADIEAWCRKDTHLAIFASGQQHYKRPGARLRLYHEGSVLRANDQSAEYVNCHPATGFLADLEPRAW